MITLQKDNIDMVEKNIRPPMAKAVTITIKEHPEVSIYVVASGFVEKPVPDAVLIAIADRLEVDND